MLCYNREAADDDDDNDRHLPTLRLSGSGRLFRVMISVIDLDPKPVHRISTWVQRKEEWLETYFNSIGNGLLDMGPTEQR